MCTELHSPHRTAPRILILLVAAGVRQYISWPVIRLQQYCRMKVKFHKQYLPNLSLKSILSAQKQALLALKVNQTSN
jgi:hypothetical protein